MLSWKEVESQIKNSSNKKNAIKVFLLNDDYKEFHSNLRKELNKVIRASKSAPDKYLLYDSLNEGLEPIYFWLLDFMSDKGALNLSNVGKEEGGYEASITGAYFGEMGARATQMQAKSVEYLGIINQLVKAIINLVYDLKEFDMRLANYDELHHEDDKIKRNGEYALKGVWMDNVDIKKGRGSINQLAQDLQMVTLRDAFFYIRSVKEIENLDLNDRIKNILTVKMNEYSHWVEHSEKELRARYNIEKAYLKSQYGTLKLYSSWVMPYLKAAEKLKMREFNSPDIVNAFSNMKMELTLRGEKEVKPIDINPHFKGKYDRKYYARVEIKLSFRTLPQTMQSQSGRQYVQGGRVDMEFRGYGVDDLEKGAMDSVDGSDMLKIIEDYLGYGLGDLQAEVDKYINPLKEEKKDDKKKKEHIKSDNPIKLVYIRFKEGVVHPLKFVKDQLNDFMGVSKEIQFADDFVNVSSLSEAQKKAGKLVSTIYDVYKSAHGMIKP